MNKVETGDTVYLCDVQLTNCEKVSTGHNNTAEYKTEEKVQGTKNTKDITTESSNFQKTLRSEENFSQNSTNLSKFSGSQTIKRNGSCGSQEKVHEAKFSSSFSLKTKYSEGGRETCNVLVIKLAGNSSSPVPLEIFIDDAVFYKTHICIENSNLSAIHSVFHDSFLSLSMSEFGGIFRVNNCTFQTKKFSQIPPFLNTERPVQNGTESLELSQKCFWLVDVIQTKVSIVDSRFVGNKLSGEHCESGTTGIVRVTNSDSLIKNTNFESSMTKMCLGCGVVVSRNGALTIENSVFVNTTGTCVSLLGSHFLMKDSLFANNSNIPNTGVSQKSVNGGTVFLTKSEGFINNTVFTINLAAEGGAILVKDRTTMFVTNCSFLKNKATRTSGGAIEISLHCTVNIVESDFTSNTAPYGGSVSLSESSVLSVKDSWFNSNVAFGSGGAIRVMRYCHVETVSANFTRNRAKDGGSIHLFHNSKMKIWESWFVKNTVSGPDKWDGKGTAILVETKCAVEIHSSYFCHNRGQGGFLAGGAAITLNQYSNMSMNASFLNKNVASSWFGGGIRASVFCVVELNSSNFTGNISPYDGGAIDMYQGSILRVYGCRFDDNSAKSGGAIFLEKLCSADVDSSHFLGNRGEETGGAINIRDKCRMKVNRTFFSNNSVSMWGGAIQVKDHSKMELHLSHFTNNTSDRSGGFMLLEDTSTLKISECSFDHNIAGEEGGAFVMKWNSRGEILSSNFTNNRAEEGGAIALTKEVNIKLYNCLFEDNSAADSGGAIHVDDECKANFLSNSFAGNIAGKGGGLYLDFSQVTLDQCQFHKNSAPQQGAALDGVDSQIHLTNSQFIGNKGTVLVLRDQNTAKTSDDYYDYTDSDVSDTPSSLINCSFRDNLQSHSIFGTDIYISAPVIIQQMSVFVYDGEITDPINNGLSKIGTFGQLMYPTTSESVEILSMVCPKYFEPKILELSSSVERATIQFGCETCSSGYYTGNSTLVSFIAKEEIDVVGECTVFIDEWNRFVHAPCRNKIMGKCWECPYGANCTSGVQITAVSNFWGLVEDAGSISFLRCPTGYCCQDSPCPAIDVCAFNRSGTLCGQCKSGFSEAFLSTECVETEHCNNKWFFGVWICWILFLSATFTLQNDIKGFSEHVKNNVRSLSQRFRASKQEGNEVSEKETKGKEEENADVKKTSLGEKKWNEHRKRTTKTPEMIKGIFVVKNMPLSEDKQDSASYHKYVQIILYYLQDATLMQVELSLASSSKSSFTESVFNFSQLTMDTFQMGKSFCISPTLTAVPKLVFKNSTGIMVLLVMFLTYLTAQVLQKLLPGVRAKCHALYERLAPAAVTTILLFYQRIASVSMSLIYCVSISEKDILHLDGTVTCYQPWQIGVFVFIFVWVVPLNFVLVFGSGLLKEEKISVFEFFICCAFPVPTLMWWLYKTLKHKMQKLDSPQKPKITEWHRELVDILQNSFKNISVVHVGQIGWLGVIKARRLVLVTIHTFVSNLVLRLSLMIATSLLALQLHTSVHPYNDRVANQAFSLSLFATISIGLINLIKAVCVEFLVDVRNRMDILDACDFAVDVIVVYLPVSFVFLAALVFGLQKLPFWKKKPAQKPNPILRRGTF